MAEEQDKTHRLLFHFPRMIQDLIRLCLGGEWVECLDFETLERVRTPTERCWNKAQGKATR